MDIAEAKLAVLRQGWLSDTPPVFQEALLKRTALLEVGSGHAVFRVQDAGGGIYGVADGAVGIYVPHRDGQDRLTHIIRAGSWFGYGYLLTRRKRILGFRTTQPSVLLHVPLPALDEISAADPAHRRAVNRISEYGMDIAIEVIADLLTSNVEKRLAATLLRIAPKSTSGPAVISGLTQAQIGEMANAARDVVNRTLKRFEASGWIAVTYRRIVLLSAKDLECFCAADR